MRRDPTQQCETGCSGTCRSDGENEYETEAEAALEEMDDAEMEELKLDAMQNCDEVSKSG